MVHNGGNVDPAGPRAPYTEGKRAAEMAMVTYHREHGVPIRIARIFSTYGPGVALDDGRVISTFIVQALRGDPITIHGGGRQTRSFCYVDDLVARLVAMIDRPEQVVGPLNLGRPEEVRISELAELIRNVTGSTSDIVYRDSDDDDPSRRCPDITRARIRLGWEPAVPLREGINRTAAWIAGEIEVTRGDVSGGRR
ncbi:MAG: NAD-dependent epimerase/dehydratase family protein [Alkalispirochaeta sp.]